MSLLIFFIYLAFCNYLKERPSLNERPLRMSAPLKKAENFNERPGLNERPPQTRKGALIWKFVMSPEVLIQIVCKNDETRIFLHDTDIEL